MQTASECPNLPETTEQTVHSGGSLDINAPDYGVMAQAKTGPYKSTPVVTFAVYIRRIREDRGFTQEQLAEAADVGVRTIARWESGATPNPPMAQLHKVLKVLGVRPEFAFRLTGWLPATDPLYEQLTQLQEQVRAMADQLREIQVLLDFDEVGPDEAGETSDENAE